MTFFRMAAAFSLAALAYPAAASSEIKYQPPAPWVEQTDYQSVLQKNPKSTNFFVVLDKQIKIEKGEQQVYVDMVMHITSAEYLTQISQLLRGYWQPDRGDLIVHRLEIIRDGKTINTLENGTKFDVIRQEKGLNEQQINGILTATAQIPGLQLGDIVRYSATTTANNPALQGKAESYASLGVAKIELDFNRVRLIWPRGEKLNYQIIGEKISGTPIQKGDYFELTVPAMVPEQTEMPADAPNRYKLSPSLMASGFADWRDVSKAAAILYKTDNLIPDGSALAAEVDKIRSATADPTQQSAMALRLVQDKVRYLFNGLGYGNYVPQTPAETWQLRYGDCKAKTLLLLSILYRLGIEAQPVLMPVGNKDAATKMLPGFQDFDHVLVRASVAGKTLWLDGTGSGTRIDDIADIPPFRYGLPLSENGEDLQELGINKPGRPLENVTLHYDASNALVLPAFFDVELQLRDSDSAQLRDAQTQSTPKAFREALSNVVDKYVLEAIVTDASFSYDETTGLSKVMAKGISYLDWTKKKQRTEHKIWSIINDKEIKADRKRKEWRTIPLNLGDGGFYREHTSIGLPDGGQGFTLDGNTTLSDSVGGYGIDRQASISGGKVDFSEDYYLKQWELPAAEIPTEGRKLDRLKNDALKIVVPANYPEKWTEMKAVLASKKMVAFKAAFDKVVADDPTEELPYRQRAYFYDLIGDPQKAVKDLDQALKIEPTADTMNWRASLLKLTDQKAAIASLKQALEIEPTHSDSLNDLVEIYAMSGQIKAAEDAIDAAYAAGLADEDAESTRAYFELLSGKKDEAIERMDKLIEDHPDADYLLGVRCWYKALGNIQLETALEDCTKAIQRSDSPAGILDSRGLVYHQLGEDDSALADYNAALELAPEQAATYYQRSVVNKAKGNAPASENDMAAAHFYSRNVGILFEFFGIR